MKLYYPLSIEVVTNPWCTCLFAGVWINFIECCLEPKVQATQKFLEGCIVLRAAQWYFFITFHPAKHYQEKCR